MTSLDTEAWNIKYISRNNLEIKRSLVTKFGQLVAVYKIFFFQNILQKCDLETSFADALMFIKKEAQHLLENEIFEAC